MAYAKAGFYSGIWRTDDPNRKCVNWTANRFQEHLSVCWPFNPLPPIIIGQCFCQMFQYSKSDNIFRCKTRLKFRTHHDTFYT